MRKVRLYGRLAEEFGKEFQFDVKSPAEALRAMCYVVPGFKQHLIEYSEPGYTVRAGKEYKDEDTLGDPCSKKEVIRISPVVAGSSAVGRIVFGVALVALAVFQPQFAAGFLSLGSGAMGSAILGMGMSLVLGGVAELLAPKPPTMGTQEAPENTPSYTFNGPVNTIGQGHAVPVGYGRLIVGSQVISAQMYSEEY